MLHVVIDFRRAQQRLGRDAAPVEADAAEVGFLDDRGLEAELCCADRGDIAAGSGADDDDVEGCVGHACFRLTQTSCFAARAAFCKIGPVPAPLTPSSSPGSRSAA